MSLKVEYKGQDRALQAAVQTAEYLPAERRALEEPAAPGYKEERSPVYSDGGNGGIWRVMALGVDRVVSASYDHLAKLWSLGGEGATFSFEEATVLQAHRKEVLSLTRLSDAVFATGSSDGTMRFWNVADGALVGGLKEKYVTGFYSMATIDSVTCATGSCQRPKAHRGAWEHAIKFWNTTTGKYQFELQGHDGGISALVPLANNHLASASADGTVRIWDVSARTQQMTFQWVEYVYGLASMDQQLITASRDRTMRLLDLEAQTESGQFADTNGFAHASTVYDVNALGQMVVSGSRDGYVKLWDVRTLSCVRMLDPADGFVFGVNFCPDGKVIAGTAGTPVDGGKKRQKTAHVVAWDFRYN